MWRLLGRRRSWQLAGVLLLALSSPAAAFRTAVGEAAGAAAGAALAREITVGPLIGGAVGIGAGRITGDLVGGFALTYLAYPVGPVLGGRIEGGYRFREGSGLVGAGVSIGWWRLSVGLGLLGAIGPERAGFALGPELIYHLRLPIGRARHELQVFARGDLFVAGQIENQATLGLRLVYDLFG